LEQADMMYYLCPRVKFPIWQELVKASYS